MQRGPMFKHFAIFAVAVTCVTFYAEAYDVPNTNQKITIANPTLCNDFVMSTTNRMAKCTFANGPHADCTQASNLPSGFYDYTDQASVACGFTWWNDAIKGTASGHCGIGDIPQTSYSRAGKPTGMGS